MAGKSWDDNEDAILKENKDLPEQDELMALLPNRSWRSIQHRLSTLGLSRNVSAEDRFWSKVDKNSEVFGDDGQYPTKCWIWTANKNPEGYGGFKLDGKERLAHRVSYLFANGEFDANLLVCHKCDMPSCVNPQHLFLGTPQDNSDDMISKGRDATRKGSDAVLTEQRVIRIRRLVKEGIPTEELSKEYGVCEAAIKNAIKAKSWSHVCGMRRFIFVRSQDVSGVSGEGIVLEGVEFTDGSVIVKWKTHTSSFGTFHNMKAFQAVHGHGGLGEVVWIDPDPLENFDD